MEQATKIRKDQYIYAKGARKTSLARVKFWPKGQGELTVNGKTLVEYFPTKRLQDICQDALRLVDKVKTVNLELMVKGGGMVSQAEACRHGISRALIAWDEKLRPVLKAEGFLKRDPRVKERKKPGLKRARRAPQWSKR
ncbi:MAG TPA: 30S ribosomal protein S9 [bacterium]|nr:30S ribosomal protein S9 [bacterium]HNS34230.1 30S ribosomal protein S9 [bacterium]HNW08990.1 30S ribosomal protein S9 [bacterium]HNZ73524.1 30S ribosomal protein S9 [bacterium]HOH67380.1 30S ribosomal protein S9 [bacterium]